MFRSFPHSSNIAYGRNPLESRSPFNGGHSPNPAMPQAGTLSRAELQRIVADMVG